jgi:Zn finger protein HypA/HybF involved in hydrogenase expression
MHEQIIAKQIIEKAKERGDVAGVTIEVGDLAHIPAEELEEIMKKMTDWNIEIIQKKATVKCSCGYKGEPSILHKGHDSTIFVCPKCQEIPQVIDGTEIILKKIYKKK